MLGKRPYLLRTSSRSLLIPNQDTEGEPGTVCKYAQVSEKSPGTALSDPCKIVIGFDIGAETKAPSDACESPRSVLDTLALHPSQEKQHAVGRSRRSGLGSLLAGKSGSGDGLEVVVAQNQGEETGVHIDSVGNVKTTFHLQNCSDETCPDKMGSSLKSSHVHCKDTVWQSSDWDYMDSDNPLWQRQAPCVLAAEDKRFDAAIAPWQSRATFRPSCQDMYANVVDMNISPNQSRTFETWNHGRIDADAFQQDSQAPWQIGPSPVLLTSVSNYEYAEHEVSTWQSATSYGIGSMGPGTTCVSDHVPTCQSEAQSLCEVDCMNMHSTTWQRQALHQMILDVESEEVSTRRRSIFCAASPPCAHSLITSFSGFLKECTFCGHSLLLGKDIFMYRGDQAFCSAECRYQKIVLDECKDSQGQLFGAFTPHHSTLIAACK